MRAHTEPRTAPRLELLAWIASVGAVTAPALSIREGSSLAAARARLGAAARSGLLKRSCPLSGQATIYTITPAGLRASAEVDLVPARVTAANAAHAATCALVAAELERRYPGRAVLGEPALRRLERSAGACLSCVLADQTGTGLRHRPDLVITADASAPVAVEVELTVKAPARLRRICLAWARCRCVEGVLYIASPPAERALLRAVERTTAGGRVVVVPLAAIVPDAPSTAARGRSGS